METKFVGKNRIFLTEVDSTNSYASELLKNVKPQNGTLVHTLNQTQGRGQRGSSWKAEPASNLTFSVLLKTDFLWIEKSFYLYKMAALACYDALTDILDKSQFDIKIKWPNDILVNRKKICGILIENTLLDQNLHWSIIGVGVNVNQEAFDVNLNAVSLYNLMGQKSDLNQLLNRILYHLEYYYLLLNSSNFKEIDTKYEKNLFGLNKWCTIEFKGQTRQFRIHKINDNGFLQLIDQQNNLIDVDVKDINWVLNE